MPNYKKIKINKGELEGGLGNPWKLESTQDHTYIPMEIKYHTCIMYSLSNLDGSV